MSTCALAVCAHHLTWHMHCLVNGFVPGAINDWRPYLYGRVFVKAHREDHPVRDPVYKLAINWGAPSWTLMMSRPECYTVAGQPGRVQGYLLPQGAIPRERTQSHQTYGPPTITMSYSRSLSHSFPESLLHTNEIYTTHE